MSESSKHQPYTYSLKTVAFGRNASNTGSSLICTGSIIFYPVPPDGALTIENLYVHLIMQFDAAIPSAARVLRKIGIIDTPISPLFFPSLVNRLKTLDVNIEADANRIIDYRIDLSSLLKKDDVAYRGVFEEDSTPENGYTMVYLEFDETLESTSNVGSILQWKTDALFTTIGIV